MPRCARKRAGSGIYHVIARGNGRQVLFEDDRDRFAFLEVLSRVTDEMGIDILAWCLMSNHIHLLLRDGEFALSEMMHRVMTSYAMRFNARSGHVGHVFQDRFKSYPIEDNDYLLNAVIYIHANPEEAGIYSMDTYMWSSYGEYVGRPHAICLANTVCVLDMVGGEEAFEKLSRSGERRGLYRLDERKRIPDEKAIALAASLLDGFELSDLKALPSVRRSCYLLRLIKAGMNPHQVERLTGIGRHAVGRLACFAVAEG